MTLGQMQRAFSLNVARLIQFAYNSGYEVTLGEAWRTPEQAARNAKEGTGIRNSLHSKRLAIDLNLFKDGVWLKESKDHLPLGTYWKGLSPDNYWGGDFRTNPDGNHYSMSPDGGVTR